MLASEHPILYAGIVFRFQSPTRPNSNRNRDLFQLSSGVHGKARDFCFPHCMYIIHHSLLFQRILRTRQCVDSVFHHCSNTIRGVNFVSFLIFFV